MKQEIRVRAAGVLSEREKVLLVCHERNGRRYWLLPGGGVEYGESLEEALKREFLEEVGLKIKVGKLLFINESIAPDGSRHGIQFTFLVKKTGGKFSVHPDFRLRDAVFHDWSVVPTLDFRPPIGNALLKAYKNRFKGAPKRLPSRWR